MGICISPIKWSTAGHYIAFSSPFSTCLKILNTWIFFHGEMCICEYVIILCIYRGIYSLCPLSRFVSRIALIMR